LAVEGAHPGLILALALAAGALATLLRLRLPGRDTVAMLGAGGP
jgi:hypothetical protein